MLRSENVCAKCFVPSCPNTTTNSPRKVFVVVSERVKSKWCRQLNIGYASRRMYCCEDHLNLEEDLENYMYWKMMKGKAILKSTAKLRNISSCSLNTRDDEQENLPSSSNATLKNAEDKMCALWLSSTCRVCLASDREMHRLANTALEETYERVTCDTLVVEGRPCCVCGVCLSALRRCRRFIDTAREANIALERWSRNQPDTHTLKLTERSLYSFTRSPTKIFEITRQESDIQEPGIKQERETADNEDSEMIHQQNKVSSDAEGNIPMVEVKFEVTSDDDNTPNSECINVYDDMIDIEIDTKNLCDVKFDTSKMLDNAADGTAPGASNVGRCQPSSDKDIPLRRLRSGKEVKLIEDTKSGPVLKLRRRMTSVHRRGNTDPAAACHEGVTFCCSQCNYRTTNKYNFHAHLKIHMDEKIYSCDKCDYKCNFKGSFKKHLFIHSGEKPFFCIWCDYKCTQSSHLKRHLLTHSGYKPFSCDKCDYKCNQRNGLKRHVILSHSGDKPLSCDECDFKCIYKSDLKRHLLTHTGEKPYACDKCDYKSSQKVGLKRHLLRHTGEKPYACDKCDCKYATKRALVKHAKNIHDDSISHL